MLRNQTLSTDLESSPRYYHQHSPRKSKQYQYTGVFQPTLLYRPKYEIVDERSPIYRWIGKKLLFWDGESLNPYIWQRRTKFIKDYDKKYVSEYEIAVYTQPNLYRIIFAEYDKNNMLRFISKPNVNLQPNRLNVIVTRDGIIRQLGYF